MLSSSDGPSQLPDVHQHDVWCIRVRTSLTEELTRFRSMLGGDGGRAVRVSGAGVAGDGTEPKKQMMCSHVSITSLPALVCHLRDRRRHDDWWPAPHFVPIMVVTRKAPLPPTPSSRSSSSQAVPRMAKVKVNQLNQPEHSSPLANGKPRTADFTVSYCSHAHSTHRLRGIDVGGFISYSPPPASIRYHLITNLPVL